MNSPHHQMRVRLTRAARAELERQAALAGRSVQKEAEIRLSRSLDFDVGKIEVQHATEEDEIALMGRLYLRLPQKIRLTLLQHIRSLLQFEGK